MRQVLFFTLACVLSTTARSQSNPFVKFQDWTRKQGMSVRKTFEGSSKDENKPATFFWNRDVKENINNHTVDLGFKIKEFELFRNSTSPLIFYPKFEWHSDTRDSIGKNVVSGGANLEFYPIPVKPKKTPAGATLNGWPLVPWIQGSSEFKNDRVKEEETITVKGAISLFSDRKLLPGSQLKVNDVLVFRYYPYSGLEHYKIRKESKGEALFWANRFFFELWPVPIKDMQYVQLTFDYTHRAEINDNLYNKHNLEWVSAGLNVYPDGKGKFGIGFEYTSGDDATADFKYVRKMTFGLKINY